MSTMAWIVIGFIGQSMYFLRMLLQWLTSEKLRRSVVPITFWYFSLAGSVILLAYAIHRRDPVFIVGQAFGFVVYLRNLWFIRREQAGAGGIAD
ncbi:MAG: lipid-A-disaccharide synthase N-terminal domain-containing protein [Gammaproteobacteria bacterium]|nr:lipid-A-disaccharide synthase N-terminal domain-containing protein [Gammaproteobacteria bacterium]